MSVVSLRNRCSEERDSEQKGAPLEGIKIAGYVGFQTNIEVDQDQINEKYNTNLRIPVVYYSQLMVYGASARKAGLDGNIARATKLDEIAAK